MLACPAVAGPDRPGPGEVSGLPDAERDAGEVVRLLADRERLVRSAAAFKTDEQAVRAPARVEAVIAKVRALAEESGASPEVIETVYRAMIGAFIDLELTEHSRSRR